MISQLPLDLLQQIINRSGGCRLRSPHMLRGVLPETRGRIIAYQVMCWTLHFMSVYQHRPRFAADEFHFVTTFNSPHTKGLSIEIAITKMVKPDKVMYAYEVDKYLHSLSVSYAYASTRLTDDGRTEQVPLQLETYVQPVTL